MPVRDSEKTKQKIIEAVERILIEKGYTGIGVNAVAREAGVDKVLIYRYFGSMEGLLRSFRNKYDKNMVKIDESYSVPEDSSFSESVAKVIMRVFNSFRKDKLAREVAVWELSDSNPLTVSFLKDIEQRQMQMLRELKSDLSPDEVTAMTIIASGLIFMVLRQSVKKPVMRLDLDDPVIAESIEKNLNSLIKGYYTDTGGKE
ncbi:hypothetical protein CSA37_01170 [Candidatus Fermentibacteria bacterium]|nr:MAG: hypothetical protein CSA37_01170 [Candidatus Fermentibacteria bacterium]